MDSSKLKIVKYKQIKIKNKWTPFSLIYIYKFKLAKKLKKFLIQHIILHRLPELLTRNGDINTPKEKWNKNFQKYGVFVDFLNNKYPSRKNIYQRSL